MEITLGEQETVCLTDSLDKTWTLYTCQRNLLKKMLEIYKPTHVYQDADGIYAAEFSLPATAVRIRTTIPKPRKPMSEEHKAKMAEAKRKKEDGNGTHR